MFMLGYFTGFFVGIFIAMILFETIDKLWLPRLIKYAEELKGRK